ncbi:MAG: hypothetical protein R3D89_13950 [Sphingomonadaceae bacterium]
MDFAIVEFERFEVAVCQPYQLFARDRRFGFRLKDRLGPEPLAGQHQPGIRIAHDYHFAFGNLARFVDLQTQAERRFLARFDHGAEIADPAGLGIGEAQLIFAKPLDRLPHAEADRQHDVILGRSRILSPGYARRIFRGKRGQIAVEDGIKHRPVHRLSPCPYTGFDVARELSHTLPIVTIAGE